MVSRTRTGAVAVLGGRFRITPLVCCAVLLATVTARAEPAALPPLKEDSMRWERRSAETSLGAGEAPSVTRFAFQNVGGQVVTIFSLGTSCPCLQAATDKRFYAPGERGEVRVTFTPQPNQLPQTKGTVLVETDSPARPTTALSLTALFPAGQLAPSSLSWTAGETLTPKTILLRLPEGAPPVRDVQVASSDLKVATAGVEPVRAGREYRVTVIPAAGATAGGQAKLTLRTEYPDGKSEVLSAPVQVR